MPANSSSFFDLPRKIRVSVSGSLFLENAYTSFPAGARPESVSHTPLDARVPLSGRGSAGVPLRDGSRLAVAT